MSCRISVGNLIKTVLQHVHLLSLITRYFILSNMQYNSRHPDDDTCGSGDITEDDEDDDGLNEPGRIPDEAVREQYMFMGNLYTLTHIRTDADKTEPKVDVVSVPKHCSAEETNADVELGHKLNGSAVPDELETTGNGVADGGSGESKQTRPPSKPSSRPASLILRSVFPADTVQE